MLKVDQKKADLRFKDGSGQIVEFHYKGLKIQDGLLLFFDSPHSDLPVFIASTRDLTWMRVRQ